MGKNTVHGLKVAYNILKGSIPTKAYRAIVAGLGLPVVAIDTLYSNHEATVLGLHRKFYQKLRRVAHGAVLKFIKENGLGACRDGRYEITISIDGCYPKCSKNNNYTSIF